MFNEAVGHRIKEQRKKLGLKQHDIANALQISPQAVSKWERGEKTPAKIYEIREISSTQAKR